MPLERDANGHRGDRVAAFEQALGAGDVAAVAALLDQDGSLANRDLRPPAAQDPHTDGFPLVRACAAGHYRLAQLLLDRWGTLGAPGFARASAIAAELENLRTDPTQENA